MRSEGDFLPDKERCGDSFNGKIVCFKVYDGLPIAQKIPTKDNWSNKTSHYPATGHEMLSRHGEG